MDLLLCLKDKKIIHGYKNGGDFDLENPKKKIIENFNKFWEEFCIFWNTDC